VDGCGRYPATPMCPKRKEEQGEGKKKKKKKYGNKNMYRGSRRAIIKKRNHPREKRSMNGGAKRTSFKLLSKGEGCLTE